MKELGSTWRRALALFGGTWRELLAADLIYRLLAAAILLPVVGLALRGFLRASGSGTVLADQDILYFVLSPIGVATLILVGGAVIAVTALETSCLMVLGRSSADGSPVGVLPAIRSALRRGPRILRTAARLVVRVVLIALPFLLVAGALAWWQLTEHDINYYLTNHPPAFVVTAATIALVLAALLVVLVPRLAGWSLVLPLVLFEGASPHASFALSAERIRGRRPFAILLLVSWGLASVLGSLLALAAVRATALALMHTLQRPAVLLPVMALVLVGWFVVTLALSILAACLFALLIVDLHAETGGTWTAARPPAPPRRQWAAANALLLLGLMATVLAFLTARGFIATARRQQPVTITGHRGAAAYAPENTLASVRLALEQGTDQVEIDVQETAEGEVVVLHDSDLMKVGSNPLKIWNATAADLAGIDIGSWFDPAYASERVPTLRQVLDVVRGHATLTIELKYYGHDQDLERRVVDLVEAAGMADDVVIISLNYAALRTMRGLRPEWPIGLLTARAVGDLTRLETDFLAVNTAIASRSFIRRAHRAGKRVFVWTVNDPASMALMVGRGVDGLITDRPGLAREMIERRAALGTAERLLLDASLALGWTPPEDDVARETAGEGIQ